MKFLLCFFCNSTSFFEFCSFEFFVEKFPVVPLDSYGPPAVFHRVHIRDSRSICRIPFLVLLLLTLADSFS